MGGIDKSVGISAGRTIYGGVLACYAYSSSELFILGRCHYVVCGVFRSSPWGDIGKGKGRSCWLLHSIGSMVCFGARRLFVLGDVVERVKEMKDHT